MELGKQIKKYRSELGLSQDGLADKIYVTRQTISNWENDRNYPDVRSLVMLSTVFGISLDTLVKGDLEEMKEQIKEEEIRTFERDGRVFTVLTLGMILTPLPLLHFLDWIGIGLWGLWAAATFWYALRIEKQKKTYDIQTYKELLAFSEGRRLDELEKYQEIGKRPYQKAALAIGAALIALAVSAVMSLLLP